MSGLLGLLLLILASLPVAAGTDAAVRSAPFLASEAVRPQTKLAQAPDIAQPVGAHLVLGLVPRQAPPAVTRPRPARALLIGDGYAVEGGQALVLDDLHWHVAQDGSASTVAQVSLPGVIGFRLAIQPDSLGTLTLRIQGNQARAQPFGPYDVMRMRAERPGVSHDEPYWLPVVEGDSVRLELTRPAGAAAPAGALRFAAASVLRHLPLDAPHKHLGSVGQSGACNLDIMCQYTDVASAVAKYLFTDTIGRTLMCTGTLLNDTTGSGTPWFVTAHHCVGTASETASMQLYWFFRSTRCNGPARVPVTTTSGGGHLLAINAAQDSSFMRLNQSPPQGTARAGWTSAQVPMGQSVLGIHHPSGDLMKYSVGHVLDLSSGLDLSVDDSHLEVGWQQGTTEGGSSGSGIFNGEQQLLAVLTGGWASCDQQQSLDYYGRFDRMMPALAQWLDSGSGSDNDGDRDTALAPGTLVTFSGRVTHGGAQGVCALVLVNGQHMFSCGGQGHYQLTAPLDANGRARVFAFADGFAPYALDVTPARTVMTADVAMSRSNGVAGPTVTLTSVTKQPNNLVGMSGRVRHADGTPLCALVLANGQHMFSCDGQGAFDLSVPRAADGSVTLFTFVDGMAPHRQTFAAPP